MLKGGLIRIIISCLLLTISFDTDLPICENGCESVDSYDRVSLETDSYDVVTCEVTFLCEFISDGLNETGRDCQACYWRHATPESEIVPYSSSTDELCLEFTFDKANCGSLASGMDRSGYTQGACTITDARSTEIEAGIATQDFNSQWGQGCTSGADDITFTYYCSASSGGSNTDVPVDPQNVQYTKTTNDGIEVCLDFSFTAGDCAFLSGALKSDDWTQGACSSTYACPEPVAASLDQAGITSVFGDTLCTGGADDITFNYYCLGTTTLNYTADWCPAGVWNNDQVIEKKCAMTKVELEIANDADCVDATSLPSANGEEWENIDEDSTICELSENDLEASECTGTFEETTCETGYQNLMMILSDCDAMVDGGAIVYSNWIINHGCCSTITYPTCDLQQLSINAASLAGADCADALSNGFDSEVQGGVAANCRCWNALGADFRAANLECIPEGDDYTITQLYEYQCGSSQSTESPDGFGHYPVFGGASDCVTESKIIRSNGNNMDAYGVRCIANITGDVAQPTSNCRQRNSCESNYGYGTYGIWYETSIWSGDCQMDLVLDKCVIGTRSSFDSQPIWSQDARSNEYYYVVRGYYRSDNYAFGDCKVKGLHLEIFLKDLKEEYTREIGLTVSEPVVSYCEGISSKTGGMKEGESETYSDILVAKSPMKHNHLYMWVEPMSNEFCQAGDCFPENATDYQFAITRREQFFKWVYECASQSCNQTSFVEGTDYVVLKGYGREECIDQCREYIGLPCEDMESRFYADSDTDCILHDCCICSSGRARPSTDITYHLSEYLRSTTNCLYSGSVCPWFGDSCNRNVLDICIFPFILVPRGVLNGDIVYGSSSPSLSGGCFDFTLDQHPIFRQVPSDSRGVTREYEVGVLHCAMDELSALLQARRRMQLFPSPTLHVVQLNVTFAPFQNVIYAVTVLWHGWYDYPAMQFFSVREDSFLITSTNIEMTSIFIQSLTTINDIRPFAANHCLENITYENVIEVVKSYIGTGHSESIRLTYLNNYGQEMIVLCDNNIKGIVTHCKSLMSQGKLKRRFVKEDDIKTGRNVFIVAPMSMVDIKEDFKRTFGTGKKKKKEKKEKEKKKKKKEEKAFVFEEAKESEHEWISSVGGIYGKKKKDKKRMAIGDYLDRVKFNTEFCKGYKSGICLYHEPHDVPTDACHGIHLMGGIQILKCGCYLSASPFQDLAETNQLFTNLGKHLRSCKVYLGIKGKKLKRKRKDQPLLENLWKAKKPKIAQTVAGEDAESRTEIVDEPDFQELAIQEMLDLQDSNLEEELQKAEELELLQELDSIVNAEKD